MENEKEALQARVTTLEALCFERFEEEDDGDVAPLEELGTLKLQPVDAMYEAASSSFYFRCTCGLLYGHANVIPDPGAFLLPCLFIMLQIASLNTVWQATWFSWYASAANYDEELYSEAGMWMAGYATAMNYCWIHWIGPKSCCLGCLGNWTRISTFRTKIAILRCSQGCTTACFGG